MKIAKNKTLTIAITILLTFSMAASMMLIPSASAHSPPWKVPTYAYVTVGPNPVGVGQYVTITCWLDLTSPEAGGVTGQTFTGWLLNITEPNGATTLIGPFSCSSAASATFKTFTPAMVGTYKVVFSWPGSTIVETSGGDNEYPQDVGDIFLGATSAPAYFTVQQASIQSWPEPPLPTSYWTLPINAQNRAWSTLASNWLGGSWVINAFQREGTGPLSAHVLWSEPLCATGPGGEGFPGGIIDAQWPSIQNDIFDYLRLISPSPLIVMNGVLYYNSPVTAQTVSYEYYAVNLYTGQLLWAKNETTMGFPTSVPTHTTPAPVLGGSGYSYSEVYPQLAFGEIYHVQNVNGNGIASFLWMTLSGTSQGTEWFMVDATTGNVIMTLTHVPSGTQVTDDNGEVLLYSYNAAKGSFLCWNSSQSIPVGGPSGTSQQQFRPPQGAVINAVANTQWENASTTWGTGLPAAELAALAHPLSGYTMNYTSPSLVGLPTQSLTILQNDQRVPVEMFMSTVTDTYPGPQSSFPYSGTPTPDTIPIALVTINQTGQYSPYPGQSSTLNNNLGFVDNLVYKTTIKVPLPGMNYTWSITAVSYDANEFYLNCQQTGQTWAYQLSTGNLLWGPTIAPSNQMYYFTYGGGGAYVGTSYYGIYIAMQANNFYGQIYAYNSSTGKPMWIYNYTAAPYGYESTFGAGLPIDLGGVCNGCLYAFSFRHAPINPLWREAYMMCINITTGALIWKIEDFNIVNTAYTASDAIADGYMISCNNYDNQLYCIGKGPSATTVSAPESGIIQGQSFTITGTVTDQSPGALAVSTKMGYGPNGVPCVSDPSQEGFMEYLYEQQVLPTNTTGVAVSISVIDPNGNYVNLGTATSNIDGVYGLSVNANNLLAGPGKYEVIANFAGSNSYGSSSATTYFTLNAAAPTAAPTASPPTGLASTGTVMLGVASIIIVIVIIGIVLAILMLRKRP